MGKFLGDVNDDNIKKGTHTPGDRAYVSISAKKSLLKRYVFIIN